MGAYTSIPNTRPDNTLLPPEIVDKIVQKLSVRDKLVSRLVCKDWNEFLIMSHLQLEVKVTVKQSDSVLDTIVNSEHSGNWTHYTFQNLELSPSLRPFWYQSGHSITYIEFSGLSIDMNLQNWNGYVKRDGTNEEVPGFHRVCPNLRHLSLTGDGLRSIFATLLFSNLFTLENLDSLNLSDNSCLKDTIVWALLSKINALKSLNLSGASIRFPGPSEAQDFYSAEGEGKTRPGNSEDDLFYCISAEAFSFEFLYRCFLTTPRAAHLTELILDRTDVNGSTLNLLSDPMQFHWQSISLNRCNHVEPANLKAFAISQAATLSKLQAVLINNPPDGVMESTKLSQLEHLVLFGGRRLDCSLEFLRNSPKLKNLYYSRATWPITNIQGLRHAKNLRALKLGGVWDLEREIPQIDAFARNFGQLLPDLVHLRELTLDHYGNFITGKVIQLIIQNLPLLEVLGVPSSRVTDLSLAGSYADIYDSRLSSEDMYRLRSQYQDKLAHNSVHALSLSDLNHLKVLNLSKCNDIGEVTWRVALNLPQLTSLDLSACAQLSKPGMMCIIAACRNLEEIKIKSCPYHIKEDKQIMEAIKLLPRIRMSSVYF